MNHIRPLFLTLAFTASLLLWASISVTPAMAANVPFDFTFTGIVTEVTDIVPNTSIGSQYNIHRDSVLMNGFYKVAAGGTAITDDNITYTASIPVEKLFFTLGNLTVDTLPQNIPNGAGSLVVSHSSNNDSYVITTAFNNNANELLGSLTIDLSGGNGTYLTTLPTLPSTPPDLGSFTTKTFRLNLFTDNGTTLQGTVIGTIAPVPLPPAVILFGAGLVALAGLGAGSWRQRNRVS